MVVIHRLASKSRDTPRLQARKTTDQEHIINALLQLAAMLHCLPCLLTILSTHSRQMDMVQIQEPIHHRISIDRKPLRAIGMTELISKIMAEVDLNN